MASRASTCTSRADIPTRRNHLSQHAQPHPDAHRQQPLLRSTGQLAQRLLHPRGQIAVASGLVATSQLDTVLMAVLLSSVD